MYHGWVGKNYTSARKRKFLFVSMCLFWWKLLGKLWDIFYCFYSFSSVVFFFYFHFIHSISASVEMLHVSMHVLQHESVIKLHFVPETFYCYFFILFFCYGWWLYVICCHLCICWSMDMYAWRIMIIIMNYKWNGKRKKFNFMP